MDRILSVTLGILLISAGLSYAQSWGIFGLAGIPPSAASAVTPNVIAAASGCGSSSAPNCQQTPQLSYQGTSFFGSVLFIGDWLGALSTFVGTFSTIVPVPGELLLAYTGGANSPLKALAAMIDLAVWFDYFVFVVLFLRGGRVS
jgi:hypothetical protein